MIARDALKKSVIAAMLACGVMAPGTGMAASQTQINSLARNVERAEGIRAIKNLQRTYAQYSQFGLRNEMASLFAENGTLNFSDASAKGRKAIAEYLTKLGGGKQGLAPGAVHTQLIEQSVVDMSVDGKTAKGRWYGFFLFADGKGGATLEGGTYENEYVKENGRWKISNLTFHTQYNGTYEDGWKNYKGQDLPVVPFHFTADQAGTPVPAPVGPAPVTKATLAELERRARALDDENQVRKLQAVYGYYVNRRMWDDVTDLFTSDSVVEQGGVGVFNGPQGVRKFLSAQGPAGLTDGVMNDRLQFDTVAAIAPNGLEAHVRGTELGLIGDANKKQAHWEVNVFDNRFVKEGGIWKIRELRVFPLFRAEYHAGFGKSREPQVGGAPDSPVPAADAGAEDRLLPAFVSNNPVTGKPVAIPADYKLVAKEDLTGKVAGAAPTPKGDTGARIDEVSRELAVARAYDAAENLSSTYGDSLDDDNWTVMSGIFGAHGAKQIPFVGYYFGAERIAHAEDLEWGQAEPAGRPNISYHWRIQPVIDVAHDGRSANLRTYLFLLGTNKMRAGTFNGAIYPMDQMVLENGVWRFWNLSLDEPVWSMPNGWKDGWLVVAPPRPQRRGLPSAANTSAAPPPGTVKRYYGPDLIAKYPPDVLISALGKREEHFIGGTGETWNWPQIMPMWFGYKNPVSGRAPPLFLNNCIPCDYAPDMEMTRHGYMNPPNGPDAAKAD